MDPNRAREIAERDQFWAALRALRAEVDRLAAGEFDADRDRQFVVVLARIVAAELDFRDRDAAE